MSSLSCKQSKYCFFQCPLTMDFCIRNPDFFKLVIVKRMNLLNQLGKQREATEEKL